MYCKMYINFCSECFMYDVVVIYLLGVFDLFYCFCLVWFLVVVIFFVWLLFVFWVKGNCLVYESFVVGWLDCVCIIVIIWDFVFGVN